MDNYFNTCPAMMNDQGRQLADFQTATRRNEYIKYVNNIVRDDEYRMFLQQRGSEMENIQWAYYKKNSNCSGKVCVHTYPLSQSPEDLAKERILYDTRNSKFNKNLRTCKKYQDYRLSDN